MKFAEKNRTILLAFQNVVTEASFLEAAAAARSFVLANPVDGIIVDFSGIQRLDVSAAFIRKFVDSFPIVSPATPRAVVAPQPAVYGIARMFQTLRESKGGVPSIVRTLDEAYKLLGLAMPEFKPVTYSGGASP